MEIVILLVPLGLLLAGLAVAAFMWGLRRGQFEDLESRGWEVVFDDQSDHREKKNSGGPQLKTPHDAGERELTHRSAEEPPENDAGDRR